MVLPYKHKLYKYGFCNLAAQLNAGTILPEGIIITLLVVLVADLIVGRSSSLGSLCGARRSSWFAHCPVLSKGCYQSSLLLGALMVTPSVLVRGIVPVCCRDDFDVDSLYRAERTALAEFIVLLLCHAEDVLSGQMSW